MNWSAFTTGRFYSSGCMYYDENTCQFNDIRESGVVDIPAKFSLVPILVPGAADVAKENWLPMPFDKALAILESSERNFLLASLEQAIEKYRVLHNSLPTQGTVLVVPPRMDVDVENPTLIVSSGDSGIQIFFLLS